MNSTPARSSPRAASREVDERLRCAARRGPHERRIAWAVCDLPAACTHQLNVRDTATVRTARLVHLWAQPDRLPSRHQRAGRCAGRDTTVRFPGRRGRRMAPSRTPAASSSRRARPSLACRSPCGGTDFALHRVELLRRHRVKTPKLLPARVTPPRRSARLEVIEVLVGPGFFASGGRNTVDAYGPFSTSPQLLASPPALRRAAAVQIPASGPRGSRRGGRRPQGLRLARSCTCRCQPGRRTQVVPVGHAHGIHGLSFTRKSPCSLISRR